jgi:hypothetical protein
LATVESDYPTDNLTISDTDGTAQNSVRMPSSLYTAISLTWPRTASP